MLQYKDIFTNKKSAALIPFFVLGDPDENTSFEMITTALDAGADILELGIPFSDPIADGPTIQKADIRALNQGMNCHKALALIKRIKDYKDVPVGLLMYYNLIKNYGVAEFYHDAAQAGVNGVLIADLSIDDADEVQPYIKQNGMDSVYMITPNTAPDRRKKVAQLCSGFIYTVSVLGVTGARNELSNQVVPLLNSLKKLTDTPLCVGFGVSGPQQATQLSQAGADGVIVGSALVKIIEQNLDNTAKMKTQLNQFISALKKAIG